jgi:hypothetical protein
MDLLITIHEKNKNLLRMSNGKLQNKVFHALFERKQKTFTFEKELKHWFIFVFQCVERCLSEENYISFFSPEISNKKQKYNPFLIIYNEKLFYQKEIRDQFYPMEGKIPEKLFQNMMKCFNHDELKEFLTWYIPVMEYTLYVCKQKPKLMEENYFPLRMNTILITNDPNDFKKAMIV